MGVITGPYIKHPLRAVKSCQCAPTAIRETCTPAFLVLLDCFYRIDCISLKCEECSEISQYVEYVLVPHGLPCVQ